MKNMVTQPRVLAKIPSHSNPNKSYEIRLGADGVVYCTCRAWITNKFCKHLEEYHARNQLVAMGAPVQAPTTILKYFQDKAKEDPNFLPATDPMNVIYNVVANGIIKGEWK